MKRWVVICYLMMIISLIVMNKVQSNGFEYSEEFELMVESKIRAPKGAKWIVSNDNKYMYGGNGEAGYIFQGLKYGDVLTVIINNQNLIVSLKYDGEKIYTIDDYEEGVRHSIEMSHKMMMYISIGFLFLIIYLIRKSE